MKTNHGSLAGLLNRWNFRRWAVSSVALISFVVGSLLTAGLMHLQQVRADSDRVFELRIYHSVPGKQAAVESLFRDTASKLLAKHDLKAVGYWVPADPPASDNTFIYILAHASREEAKKNWAAMYADPGFEEMIKSEEADKSIEKIDSTYMLPMDFSPMK